MPKQKASRRFPAVFLILGIAFLSIGIATDQTTFTWIAIAFTVIAMVSNSKWFRQRR